MVGGCCTWSSAVLVSRTFAAAAAAGRGIFAIGIPLFRLEVWVVEVSIVVVRAVTHVSNVQERSGSSCSLSED